MRRTKYAPAVYAALRDAGMSNREVARQLDVDEASVRRGLRGYMPADPPPEREPQRQYLVTVTPVD